MVDLLMLSYRCRCRCFSSWLAAAHQQKAGTTGSNNCHLESAQSAGLLLQRFIGRCESGTFDAILMAAVVVVIVVEVLLLQATMCVCVCVYVSMHVCMCMCICVVYMCVCVCDIVCGAVVGVVKIGHDGDACNGYGDVGAEPWGASTDIRPLVHSFQ